MVDRPVLKIGVKLQHLSGHRRSRVDSSPAQSPPHSLSFPVFLLGPQTGSIESGSSVPSLCLLQPLPQPMNPVCSISKTAALFQILNLITGLLVSLPPILGSLTWDSAETEASTPHSAETEPSTPHRGWVWGMAWVQQLMSALSLHGLSHRLPELPHFSKAASFFMQLV